MLYTSTFELAWEGYINSYATVVTNFFALTTFWFCSYGDSGWLPLQILCSNTGIDFLRSVKLADSIKKSLASCVKKLSTEPGYRTVSLCWVSRYQTTSHVPVPTHNSSV